MTVLGWSWISPSKAQMKEKYNAATSIYGRFRAYFSLAQAFHILLIPANACVIAGGSILAGVNDFDAQRSKVLASRSLRIVGQSIFLAQTIFAIGLAIWCYFRENIRHININAIFLISPFLLVRGIFGVISIYIKKMDYFNLTNYNVGGIKQSFVVYEYLPPWNLLSSLCKCQPTIYLREESTQNMMLRLKWKTTRYLTSSNLQRNFSYLELKDF
ncbi:uncharacterized protein RJT20DRAFT_2975 [Scheffersomyces xylosifermentans]|uniref:uncharacterized protein n=1 Tax=Scheffersomyces xylosifermentans TaxID=1304137 RepID=UPI00315DC554